LNRTGRDLVSAYLNYDLKWVSCCVGHRWADSHPLAQSSDFREHRPFLQFLPLTLPTAYLNPFLMGGPSGVGNGNTSKWNSSGKPWHVHCVGYVPFVPLQVCFGPKEAGLNGLECLGSLIFCLLLGFGDEKSGRKRTGIDLPSSSLPNDFRSVCFTSQGQN
jgi:hypothetical protein